MATYSNTKCHNIKATMNIGCRDSSDHHLGYHINTGYQGKFD